ncbi:hypothetical protein RB195_019881 [Necator americanus]|uniref:Uncharacterized protein n=2 Tax=Necator americanus TaxID=51031 RepID=A0ABR1CG76_NECAM|nr:hypothetical protein NECAME_09490 [Necator americanus]ETN79953.1 hypothetical protein NECAME_09490 [Necator americanus]
MRASGLREPVNSSFIIGMDDVVVYHKVNTILGAAVTLVNVLLLFVFCTSSSLRRKSEVLIALCAADGVNCFSISLMGLNRVLLYTKIIETLTIPIRTSWECAVEPWLITRGFGDLWPPTVQIAMAIDRCLAVFNPISYRKSSFKRNGVFFLLTISIVTCELLVGYFIAWTRRLVKVKYWCGRKAAFGDFFASFLYASNIVCYLLAFTLTLMAYFKSQYWMDKNSSREQLVRIRYLLMISILSIILISIPNGISLFYQYISHVANAIAKPSTYLTCVNSGINIFVYLVFYKEFRDEFKRIILRINKIRTIPVISDKIVTTELRSPRLFNTTIQHQNQ